MLFQALCLPLLCTLFHLTQWQPSQYEYRSPIMGQETALVSFSDLIMQLRMMALGLDSTPQTLSTVPHFPIR